MLPNLTGLPRQNDRLEDVGAPSDGGDVPKVVGGCNSTTERGRLCMDEWVMAMIGRLLENPRANAIILLAVGEGVIELDALKEMIGSRADNNQTGIRTIMLIDPWVPDDIARETQERFKDAFGGVEVTYYNGERAYDNAVKAFIQDYELNVGVVGGINFGQLLSTHPAVRNTLNMQIALAEVIKERQKARDPTHAVYAITAYQDAHEVYHLKKETMDDFAARHEDRLRDLTEFHLQEFYRPPPIRR